MEVAREQAPADDDASRAPMKPGGSGGVPVSSALVCSVTYDSGFVAVLTTDPRVAYSVTDGACGSASDSTNRVYAANGARAAGCSPRRPARLT